MLKTEKWYWGYEGGEQKYKVISSMLKNEGLFVFRANVFRLKQIWLGKHQAGAAATVLSGFLAELEVHWDPRQNPEEPQLTSALCPISSLPVTRVHYCSSSRGHTLPVSGWNLF